MQTLRLGVNPGSLSQPSAQAALDRAAALLRSGGLVALPTETVYGLGANALNPAAVARIFAAKQRPAWDPVIVHIASLEMLAPLVLEIPSAARRLMEAFWPGPLTLVLPRGPDCRVSLLAGAGLDTLAVRVPAHPVALALLRAAAFPVAGPSANPSGRVSPTTAADVLEGLAGRIAAVIDAGSCRVGVESTVLDLSGEQPTLLRPGGLRSEAIEARIGKLASASTPGAAPRGPGMLRSHYAPLRPVRLEATSVAADEALLAFGPPPVGAGVEFQLSAGGDLREAAARLFAGLRWLDAEAARLGLARIAVMAIPERGLGRAINDRLRRAAAPRP
jgi:L-threonylcarbamoyladenylate synthase